MPPPPRRLGAAAAALVVVASMIGVGVFTTTGLLIRDLGSVPAVLAAWALGGLVALCGALAYAELVSALPENGGEYALLSRIYHPSVGFVAGWVSFIVGFSAPTAAAAIGFGRYLSALLPGLPSVAAAALAVVALAALHGARVVLGSRVQSAITAAQAVLIAAFIAGSLLAGTPQQLVEESGPPLDEVLISPAFAVGVVYVSFSYSGWNAAVYVAGEVKEPARTLPRALVGGTGLVVALYLGLNAVFLMSAPARDLAGVIEIGHVAAVRLFGDLAGQALSGIIALGLLASVGALLMTGARVYDAMGRDYPTLRALSRRTTQSGPLLALGLQATTALLLVVTASFDALLAYIGFTLSLFSALAVAGVFVLRRREPHLVRPYRTWGHPVTTVTALLLMTWMVVYVLVERPLASIAGLVTVAAGLGIYGIVRRSTSPAS